MSIEVTTEQIPHEAQVIIDAWDALTQYYISARAQFDALSETYVALTGTTPYNLADPLDGNGKFCMDHIRMLVRVAETHFAVGSVKLTIDEQHYYEVCGAVRPQHGGDMRLNNAEQVDLEAVWNHLVTDHGNSGDALAKAKTDTADVLLDAISIRTWVNDEVNRWETKPASKHVLTERLLAKFKVTKAYHTCKFSARMDTVGSYSSRTGDYCFDWEGARKVADTFKALIDWANLYDEPDFADDCKAVVAKADDRDDGFSLADKIINTKRLRVIIRKGAIEVGIAPAIAIKLQEFLGEWAKTMKDAA